MNKLENRVALITGGAGGIGTATAKLFAEEGASVMLVDLEKDSLEESKKEIGRDRVEYITADVSKPEEVEKYVKATVEKFGGIDVFFNNAGIEGDVKPVTDYPLESFQKVFDVNVKGAWLGLKYVIPKMKENEYGGSIIITSSVAGLAGTANVSPYVGSKHALIGIMKSVALEVASANIRVNSINPSPVDNRMMRSLEKGFSDDDPEEAKKMFEQMIPLGRYADNMDIAKLALFLASEESAFITGSVHRIDGGMLSST